MSAPWPWLAESREWNAGWELLCAHRYHAAHEPFELLWRGLPPPARPPVQALIHLCAALFHASRQRPVGQVRQAARGLARLPAGPQAEPLSAALREVLLLLQAQAPETVWRAAVDALVRCAGEQGRTWAEGSREPRAGSGTHDAPAAWKS